MPELLPIEGVTRKKRLRILTEMEIEDLYSRPQLTENDRAWLFDLNQEEQRILTADFTISTKIDAIVRLGYFKRKQQFFQFKLHEISDDVKHIMARYFDLTTLDKYAIGQESKLNNQQWVLSMLGYKLFSHTQHTPMLLKKAEKLCRLSVNPSFIFQELLAELTQMKISRPGYSTFQKIVSCALVTEQKRVSKIFKEHLLPKEKEQLFSLLGHKENFYAITLLKHQPKNFKPTAIRQEIAYYEQYQHLYQICKRLLPLLEISKNSVAYYANLIEHYTVQSLNRINKDQTYLFLLCSGLTKNS